MKNTKILYSKPAIVLYAGVIVLLATLFGYEEQACKLASLADIEVEACAVEVPEAEAIKDETVI